MKELPVIRPVLWWVAGKHQCRALAESMYSPNEGLREIGRQLSTDATQELLQYCNGLGEGEACCVCTPSIGVQHRRVTFVVFRWRHGLSAGSRCGGRQRAAGFIQK